MLYTSCKVCLDVFNDRGKMPKSLECGHTICLSCVTELLVKSPSCPECTAPMALTRSTNYPTNVILLEINQNLTQSKGINLKLQIQIQDLQRALIHLKNKGKNEKTKKEDKMNFMKSSIKNLGVLAEQTNLQEEEEELLQLINVFKGEIKLMEANESDTYSVTFKMSDFDNEDDYLYEIYNRVQNGEEYYAVKFVDGKEKFGKISVLGNKILVHSLTFNEVPQGDKIVKFQDIKKCSYQKKHLVFLKICCNDAGLQQIVTIEMMETPLLPQFTKLCTGECGPSYKGCLYSQYSALNTELYQYILGVDNYVSDSGLTVGKIDYFLNCKGKLRMCSSGEVILTSLSIGSFAFVELFADMEFDNVIGKVVLPCDFQRIIKFEKEHRMKIVDSGLVLTLGEV